MTKDTSKWNYLNSRNVNFFEIRSYYEYALTIKYLTKQWSNRERIPSFWLVGKIWNNQSDCSEPMLCKCRQEIFFLTSFPDAHFKKKITVVK